MAVSNSDRYEIQRAFALVIVNKIYDDGSWLPNRPGAEIDRKRIMDFCTTAGFTVNDTDRSTSDLSVSDMTNLFTAISRRDFTSYDAFICFISSHGDEGGIHGVDGEPLSVDVIVSKFKELRTLVGKPKIFFIQNCRGKKVDRGVVADGGVQADSGYKYERPLPIRVPKEADVLIAHSSVNGYESYRNVDEGSWFITVLMKVLEEHAHKMSLTDLLTIVNERVADMKTVTGKRQMPCFTSTLRKSVHFKIHLVNTEL